MELPIRHSRLGAVVGNMSVLMPEIMHLLSSGSVLKSDQLCRQLVDNPLILWLHEITGLSIAQNPPLGE